MSLICGIDADSEAIHFVFIDEEAGAYHGRHKIDLRQGKEDAFGRARRVRRFMPLAPGAWLDYVIAVGIEQPYSNHWRSLAAQLRVQGAILACLPDSLLVLDLPAQRWKKETVGSAKASKQMVARWAIEQGLPDGLEQDHYDAFAIARATLVLMPPPATIIETAGRVA